MFTSVNLQLQSVQCRQLILLLKATKMNDKIQHYLRYRPKSLTFVPSEWWKYSLNCVLWDVRKQLRERQTRTLDFLVRRGKWRREYCNLYRRKVVTYSTNPLAGHEEKRLRDLEEGSVGELGVDDIVVFRAMVHKNRNSSGAREKYDCGSGEGDSSQSEIEYDSDAQEGDEGIFHSLATSIVTMSSDLFDDRTDEGDSSSTPFGTVPRASKKERLKENERLLEYLNKHLKKSGKASSDFSLRSPPSTDFKAEPAVKVSISLPHGSVTFFSSNSHISPSAPQIPFLELNLSKLSSSYTLFSNYVAYKASVNLADFQANEISQNGTVSRLVSRHSHSIEESGEERGREGGKREEEGREEEEERRKEEGEKNGEEVGGPSELFTFLLDHRPVDKPQFHDGITANLEQLHIYVSPSFTTLKEFNKFGSVESFKNFKSSSSSSYSQSDTFYATLNATGFNSARRKLQRRARLSRSQHKNVFVDVNFNAPIVTIAGASDKASLIIDLGKIQFFNGRVAGLASSMSSSPVPKIAPAATATMTPGVDNGADGGAGGNTIIGMLTKNRETEKKISVGTAKTIDFSSSMMSDDTNVQSAFQLMQSQPKAQNAGPLSPSPALLPSSPPNVGSRSRTASARKATLSDNGSEFTAFTGLTSNLNGPRRKSKAAKLLQENFYDVFWLVLSSISITLEETVKPDAEMDNGVAGRKKKINYELVKKFDVRLAIQKSVIPQDYTLPKVKVNCTINLLEMHLSTSNAPTLSSLIASMKAAMSDDCTSNLTKRSSQEAFLDKFKVPQLSNLYAASIKNASQKQKSRPRERTVSNLDVAATLESEFVMDTNRKKRKVSSSELGRSSRSGTSDKPPSPNSIGCQPNVDIFSELEYLDVRNRDGSNAEPLAHRGSFTSAANKNLPSHTPLQQNIQMSSSFFTDAQTEEFINPEVDIPEVYFGTQSTSAKTPAFFSPASNRVPSSTASNKTPSISSRVGYLNSENLAYLDANAVGVDPSNYDSASDDSFHSAVSIDQQQLKVDLASAIEETRVGAGRGEGKVAEIDLLRNQAELRALMAARKEIEHGENEVLKREGALRAKALLRSRAKKASLLAIVESHEFIPGLEKSASKSNVNAKKGATPRDKRAVNVEMFYFTFELKSFKFGLVDPQNTKVLSLGLNNIFLLTRGRTADFRAKVMLDSFAIDDGDNCLMKSFKCSPSGEALMFPDFCEPPGMRPHSQQGSFLHVTVEKSKRRDGGGRVKVDVRGVEGCVDEEGLKRLIGVWETTMKSSVPKMKNKKSQMKTATIETGASDAVLRGAVPLGISVHFQAINMKLHRHRVVSEVSVPVPQFSVNLTNFDVRLAKADLRRQLDVIIGGVRLFEGSNRYDIFRVRNLSTLRLRATRGYDTHDLEWLDAKTFTDGSNVTDIEKDDAKSKWLVKAGVTVDMPMCILYWPDVRRAAKQVTDILDVVAKSGSEEAIGLSSFQDSSAEHGGADDENGSSVIQDIIFDGIISSVKILVPSSQPSSVYDEYSLNSLQDTIVLFAEKATFSGNRAGAKFDLVQGSLRVEDLGLEGGQAFRESSCGGSGVRGVNVSVSLTSDEEVALDIAIGKVEVKCDPTFAVNLGRVLAFQKIDYNSDGNGGNNAVHANFDAEGREAEREFSINLHVEEVVTHLWTSHNNYDDESAAASLSLGRISINLEFRGCTSLELELGNLSVVDERSNMTVFHPTSPEKGAFVSLAWGRDDGTINRSGMRLDIDINPWRLLASPIIINSLASFAHECRTGLELLALQKMQRLRQQHQQLRMQNVDAAALPSDSAVDPSKEGKDVGEGIFEALKSDIGDLALRLKFLGCEVALPCSEISLGLEEQESLEVVISSWTSSVTVNCELLRSCSAEMSRMLKAQATDVDVDKVIEGGAGHFLCETNVKDFGVTHCTMVLEQGSSALEVLVPSSNASVNAVIVSPFDVQCSHRGVLTRCRLEDTEHQDEQKAQASRNYRKRYSLDIAQKIDLRVGKVDVRADMKKVIGEGTAWSSGLFENCLGPIASALGEKEVTGRSIVSPKVELLSVDRTIDGGNDGIMSSTMPMSTPDYRYREGGKDKRVARVNRSMGGAASVASTPVHPRLTTSAFSSPTAINALSLLSEGMEVGASIQVQAAEARYSRSRGVDAEGGGSSATEAGNGSSSSSFIAEFRKSICLMEAQLAGFQLTFAVVGGSGLAGQPLESPPRGLAKVCVGSVGVSAGAHTGVMSGSAEFRNVTVTYLNQGLNIWEPLIETWGFHLLSSAHLDLGNDRQQAAERKASAFPRGSQARAARDRSDLRRLFIAPKGGKNHQLRDVVKSAVKSSFEEGEPKMREVARKMTQVFSPNQILQTWSKDSAGGGEYGASSDRGIEFSAQVCMGLLWEHVVADEAHDLCTVLRSVASKVDFFSLHVPLNNLLADGGYGTGTIFKRKQPSGFTSMSTKVSFSDTVPLNINITEAFMKSLASLEMPHKRVVKLDSGALRDSFGSKEIASVQNVMKEPCKIMNHLPLPLLVEVMGSSGSWNQVGEIGSGQYFIWDAGCLESESEMFELRCKFPLNAAPQWADSWSSTLKVDGVGWLFGGSDAGGGRSGFDGCLSMTDVNHACLEIRVTCGTTNGGRGDKEIPVLQLSVPFWIVNATKRVGKDLQFRIRCGEKSYASENSMAGSSDGASGKLSGGGERARLRSASSGSAALPRSRTTSWRDGHFLAPGQAKIDQGSGKGNEIVGLKRLIYGEGGVDAEGFLYEGSERAFDVIMVGDEHSTDFSVRGGNDESWCRAVGMARSQDFDVKLGGAGKRLSLCSMVIVAPKNFGGDLGTKFLCISNRFTFANLLGREMAVKVCKADGKYSGVSEDLVLSSDGYPTDFHFEESGKVRIRPTEYGWSWSGAFKLKRKRSGENANEIIFRMCNELNGKVIVCSVEFEADSRGGVVVKVR